jgi:hypothetical protein
MEITHKYWTMWTFLTLTALTTAPCLTAQVPDYMLKSVAPSQSGSYPVGLAIDAAGNVYYCGTSDGAIWKIPTTGKPSAFAGGGNSTNGLIGDGGPAAGAHLVADVKTFAPGQRLPAATRTTLFSSKRRNR